jgi:CRISPR-associated protein Cmr1
MPRHLPEYPGDWKKPTLNAGRMFDIELITPLFGGGVTTRANDPLFPIRPTAIRGQLQFWWRATVGAKYDTKERLRAEQSRIWGDTKQSSRVQLRVDGIRSSESSPCGHFEKDRNHPDTFRSVLSWNKPFDNAALSYALFPFQGQLAKGRKRIEVDPATCIHKASFKLILQCSNEIDFKQDIEPALWAWVNFGGLGSRTRRGCGSIVCMTLAPKEASDLPVMWKRFMPGQHPIREWPTVAASGWFQGEQSSAHSAWEMVIQRFRDFRQGVGVGRNPGQQTNRPGRSRYPEPESIRSVLWDPKYPWPHERLEHIPDDAFPRAEFGLPIVFHFQSQGEPADTVLYPDNDTSGNKRERMASPLILKPLALQSGKAIPLILQLKSPVLKGVDLRKGEKSVAFPTPPVIRAARLASYQKSPLAGSPSGSALEAFLVYVKSEGFQEVPV